MTVPSGYFRAHVACEICRVTPRMLDYWITTAVIRPARVYEYEHGVERPWRRKAYYLFDFKTLVQVKIVKELRDAGVALQRIRFAIEKLRRKGSKSWESAWIVTDGKKLYENEDSSGKVESLMKGESGQLVFSVIALGAVREQIAERLGKCSRFRHEAYNGTLKRWEARTIAG